MNGVDYNIINNNNAQKNTPKNTIRPWEVADTPWRKIHVDFAGPINGEMFSFPVNAHWKWPEALCMPHITTEQTIDALKTIFCRFGFPEILVSDNGTQFTAEKFASLYAKSGIRHITTVPYHRQSHGQVGRFVDTLECALRRTFSENSRKIIVYGTF
ncbi:unnamed protein product [Anisakis simplex]|uniref:Integrase catalytic domain-containing protein n=1 Tax=Anisakis simplex TaxID=6269 RepID=A0A0M3JTE8_ANISI|nr:unnamed protein product [Anisakis simplex]